MAAALIHVDAVQKERLAWRAKLRGESFCPEVRDAADLYLGRAEWKMSRNCATRPRPQTMLIKNRDETAG